MSKRKKPIIFKKIACKGKYHDPESIPMLVDYITNAEKTTSGIIYGVKVDMDRIAESMVEVSENYKKNSRLRLHHFILTFDPNYYKKLEILETVTASVCDRIGLVYQIVAAVHENTDKPHIHFVFNAVSYINGYKYRGGKEDYNELIAMVKEILSEYSLYPVIPVKYKPRGLDLHE